jgi:hypothetical protein
MENAIVKNSNKVGSQPDYKGNVLIDDQQYSVAAWFRTPMPTSKSRVITNNLNVSFTLDYEKVGSANLYPTSTGYKGSANIDGVQYTVEATDNGASISLAFSMKVEEVY